MSTAGPSSSSSPPFPAPPNTPPALIPPQLHQHQPMVIHSSPPPIATTSSSSSAAFATGEAATGGGEEEGGEQRGGGKVVSMAVSPPTPAPSPRPSELGGPSLGFGFFGGEGRNEESAISSILTTFNHLTPSARLALLTSLLPLLKTPELLLLSHHISPRLKRDFLRDLPLEISLHVLSFVDSPRTLARASCVSKFWRRLLEDEWTWKEMCARHRFGGGVMSGMVLGNQAQAPPLVLTSASTKEGGGGGGGEFVPIPAQGGIDSPNAASFVSSSGIGGPSIPTATASTNMTFGTPQHQPASSNSGSSLSMSSSLGSASTMQSGLSSTSPSHFSSLLPASAHVTFNTTTTTTTNASTSSSSNNRGGPNPTNPNTSLPLASGSILTYPLPPNLPTSAPTQFSSIPSHDDEEDHSDDDDDPMTDLTASQPSASAPGIAPLGFLSTVPFASSSSSSQPSSRRRLVPRGLGIVGGFGANQRSVSSPLTRGESHHGGGVSKDWKQHNGKGKGKGKRRASAEEEQEQEEDEGRFSYKRHFKRAYLTESNWLRGGRLLSTHTSTDDGVVTSLAVDDNHIVIGMANCKIHVFESETGMFLRTLVGHDLGVWCLTLVTAGGTRKEAPPPDEDVLDDSMDFEYQQQQQPNSTSFYKASTRRSSTDAIVWDGSSNGAGGSRNNNHNYSALSSSAAPLSSNHHHLPVGPGGGPSSSTFDNYPSHLNSVLSAGSNPMSSTASLPATFANISDVPGMGSFLGSNSAAHGGPGGFGGGLGGGAGGAGGGRFRKPQSDVCGAAKGWGQEGAVIVSGGCDRDVRVWDAENGVCKHILRGHTSTIRCLKVLDGRPIAVSGSRDSSLRVWDIEKGVLLHLLSGHQHSVRCIEVAGNKVVSGSYDCTCRLWDLDTGECLQVFRGHYHQIYAVAFDGERVATGSLDSTVRVWSAQTGECLALLQGHTSLVGQLQLTNDILVTGGSDGRVIIFSLSTFECLHRLCAHDNSVTCLQFDDRFIVSGGNDGRVKLWDLRTGAFIRELSKPCEAVWRVTFKDDKCVVLCKRGGKTVMEVLTFRPSEDEL